MVIRIGAWNLENLFKPPNPFSAPKTEELYQAKLGALAKRHKNKDPHVLAVHQAGDPVALGELAAVADSAARRVESTMSVKSTMASTRSSARTPDRNLVNAPSA